MQKKKQHKPIKKIILLTILAILLLLLIFVEDIIKLTNSNKTALLENTPSQTSIVEPNIPVLSAGMIPIKWNGTNFVITTQEDKDWYDYKNGKPAYIMLNDGYYQSELKRGITDDQVMENAVGNDALVVPNVPNNNPTILMWIPRFAINNETNEIQYIKGIEQTDENWTIPEIFTHKQEAETAPDFLLTGIWLEKNIDANFTNKITQMNSEESIYGFIKNTIALSSNQIIQNTIENYIANITNGTTRASFPTDSTTNTLTITDPSNPNRIILKIINQNNQAPIKAKAIYNKDTGLIEVQVTYSQYGIAKILYENTQELKLTKNGNKATATSEGLDIKYGTAKITIIDNKGNTKELELAITSKVYVTLYTDGTLGFCSNSTKIAGKTVSVDYGDISEREYTDYKEIPWYSKNRNIETVEFVDEVAPISTANWFSFCVNLSKINSIVNLNTSSVTNMSSMFAVVNDVLTELDVSNFDTSNVTNMWDMFDGCRGITELDVSNFDTSNVTNMGFMFGNCKKLVKLDVSNFDTSNVNSLWGMFLGCNDLTELDVSNFDTSNVTNMQDVFNECSSLTKLDLSNLDISKVTNINGIFYNCSSLSQITFGEKWDKEITLPTLTKPCAGWYSDEGFTNKVADAGANYTPTGPITIYANVPPDIFVKLYTDGTLAFCSNNSQIPFKELSQDYGNIGGKEYTIANSNYQPWYDRSNSPVKTVQFIDKILPVSTSCWFHCCTNLTTIKNIENLDTKNVTNMNFMFNYCENLTQLDLSNFNTSKVADMRGLIRNCATLTSIDLSSFDTSRVTDMTNMFDQCSSLISLDLSNFDTSNVVDMTDMFTSCTNLTQLNLSNFNTSSVTDMASMFSHCTNLKSIDLSSFNTNSVTNISCMFDGCTNLTSLDLSSFDTNKVTSTAYLFSNCSNLTQITFGEKWNKSVPLPVPRKTCTGWYSDSDLTTKVADAGASYNPNGAITIYANVPPDIFAKLYTDGTLAFCSNNSQIPFKELSQDYGNIGGQEYSINTIPWKNERASITELEFIDKVQPISTNSYFWHCENLATIKYIANLDTSKVTDMCDMFAGCSSLTDIDVSNFDTNKVTDMGEMFLGCSSLTNIDISNFDTSNVTQMYNMFNGCSNLTQLDLSNFNTSKVTNINSMLYNCSNLTQITFGEKWNKSVPLPVPRKTCTGWYSDSDFTTKVADAGASYMPTGPITIYTDVVPDIYVTLYTDGTLAFAETKNPFPEKTIDVQYEDVSEREGTNNWTEYPWYNERNSVTTVEFVNKISPISTSSWFAECRNLTTIKNIENLDTSKVTNMSFMFYFCDSLTELDLSSFDTSNVTNMQSMFNSCWNLKKINISSFNTSNVTNMYLMFAYCWNLTEIDVSGFDTNKVTGMDGMFLECKSLTEIDVSNFNVSNVTDIGRLFSKCSSLTKIDISNFNKGSSSTKNVTDMNNMFSYCTNLTDLNLGNLDTSNVTNMSYMFNNCNALISLNLSSFNTSKVTNMSYMFNNCNILTSLNLSSFNTSKVTYMNYMFYNCTNLKTIYVGTYWRLASTRTDMFTGCGTSTTTRK